MSEEIFIIEILRVHVYGWIFAYTHRVPSASAVMRGIADVARHLYVLIKCWTFKLFFLLVIDCWWATPPFQSMDDMHAISSPEEYCLDSKLVKIWRRRILKPRSLVLHQIKPHINRE
jgi:hypothetical protein